MNYYRCHCAVGTTQPNCDDIIQECLSNPCKNNGTCIELVNAYQCSCPAGTTGVHCDGELCSYVKKIPFCTNKLDIIMIYLMI